MRVSVHGNSRPVFGERTNSCVPNQVKSTQSPKKVSFSCHLVRTEITPSPSKKRHVLKSSLRSVRRYGNKKTSNPVPKPQRTMAERLAERDREVEPDNSILRKVASLLESKLSEIKEEHEEALMEIEEEKQKEMEKIHQECLIEHKLARSQQKKEDETFSHDLQVMKEMIAALRDTNQIMKRENEELMDDVDEIKNENKRLFDKTSSYNKAMRKIKAEIAEEEERNQELQGMVGFLKMRKKEYENARFEADQDIADERAEAAELRSKIENVVAEIDKRCTERGFVNAVNIAVSKDFAAVEASNSRKAAYS